MKRAFKTAGLTKSMDETSNNPANWELEVVEPAKTTKPAKVRKPSRVSDQKLEQALKELNLLSISSDKLRGYSTVGRFLDQIGIVQYGNGRLVGSAVAMETAMQVCADVVAKAGNDSDLKERFITLQIRLAKAIDSHVSSIKNGTDTGFGKKPTAEQQNKPFAVGSVIVPIQINAQANQVATPEKAS